MTTLLPCDLHPFYSSLVTGESPNVLLQAFTLSHPFGRPLPPPLSLALCDFPYSPALSRWDRAFLTLLLALFTGDLSYGREVGVAQGRQEEEGEKQKKKAKEEETTGPGEKRALLWLPSVEGEGLKVWLSLSLEPAKAHPEASSPVFPSITSLSEAPICDRNSLAL